VSLTSDASSLSFLQKIKQAFETMPSARPFISAYKTVDRFNETWHERHAAETYPKVMSELLQLLTTAEE
jgi:hypothetical protein